MAGDFSVWTSESGTRGKPEKRAIIVRLRTPDGDIQLEVPAPVLADREEGSGQRMKQLVVSALDSLRVQVERPSNAGEFRDRPTLR